MRRRTFLKALAALPLLALPLQPLEPVPDLDAQLAAMDAKLFPNGGWLVEEQANRFIKKLIAEPTMLRGAPVEITMRAPQQRFRGRPL